VIVAYACQKQGEMKHVYYIIFNVFLMFACKSTMQEDSKYSLLTKWYFQKEWFKII